RPDAGTDLAELRRVGRDAEVAEDVQDVAAADGVAVDGGDDRLGDVADHPVEVVELEDAGGARTVVSGLGPLLGVAIGAERPVAGAGQDDGGNGRVGPGVVEGGD